MSQGNDLIITIGGASVGDHDLVAPVAADLGMEQSFYKVAMRPGKPLMAGRLGDAAMLGLPGNPVSAMVCGQVFASGVGVSTCLDALEPAWTRALAEAEAANASGGPVRRGVGVAAGWYGCGNTSLPNPSTIRIGITPDGRLRLHQGATDIGQGSTTVIAQIAADALGVEIGSIRLASADTDITPDAGKTSASRQTFVSGNAAGLTATALRKQILRFGN